MANKNFHQASYFELSEHNTLQVIVFYLLIVGGIALVFLIILPLLGEFFKTFLNGIVYNDGQSVPYAIDVKEPLKQTDFLFSWAVDVYIKTPEEARYWFNPLLTIILPAAIIGLGISVVVSSVMPQSIGYMRQKIEREIANTIDKISLYKFGYHIESNTTEIVNDILQSDMRDLLDMSNTLNIQLDDLKILYKALIWKNSSLMYKLLHFNDGFRIYMRNYFTLNYSNAILGMVYIGAAILIIIIGLRGLKFIPPTQPSLVLFALGLEFSLLIIYALTLMYSKSEEETESFRKSSQKPDSLLLMGEFGNSKEIESLLRVFIKRKKIQ